MATAQDEFEELMRDKVRRSMHPEDSNDDARSFLNLSDDEEDHTPPASHAEPDDFDGRASSSMARSTIPLTRYEANTGPKGVIADAQHFRDSQRNRRISMKAGSSLQTQTQERLAPQNGVLSEKLTESDEDLEDDMNDEYMQEWRQKRLKEMQNGGRESGLSGRGKSRRVWGALTMVDGNGYLDAVDNSPADTVVVVYIYDDYSHVSDAIEDCVRTLAQKHVEVRFVKLHFEEAEMEPTGVPALLAYRSGDKFAGLVPMIDEIPDDADLSASTIEVVLRRHQILRS